MRVNDNKLIMKFMGVEPTRFNDIWSWSDSPMFYCQGNREYVIDCVADYVKYSTSWDALKPVIDKIIKTIGLRTIDECTEEEWRLHTSISRMYTGVPIEWAYNYVIEWLKWYYKLPTEL